ncbi:MAG: glutamate 5-kinase [Bacteriovoracia bacterium]
MKKRRRWVIKVGSQLVCTGGPLLVREWMQQVLTLQKRHRIDVVWVSSGAIHSAIGRTGRSHGAKRTLSEKQALSAIGQPMVMDLYNLALQASGMLGAQVLLTYDDLDSTQRRQNFLNTLGELLKWGAVPILNENDAVATEEIKFGDNDSLSAKVAIALRAERLIILSDVEGLYTENPAENPRARLVRDVEQVNEKVLKMAPPNTKSSRGTGGMYSKLLAGREAARAGVETYLVKGDRMKVLLDLADGLPIGTRIHRRASRG